MDNPGFIVCSNMENSIGLKRVKITFKSKRIPVQYNCGINVFTRIRIYPRNGILSYFVKILSVQHFQTESNCNFFSKPRNLII